MSPSGPRVLITHPSKQSNIYERPRAAQRAGLPVQFWTGIYDRPAAFPYNLARLAPGRAGRRLVEFLSRRSIPGLDPANVASPAGPWPELCLRRFGGYPAIDRVHDFCAARWLRALPEGKRPDVVHGFPQSFLHTLRAAKAQGARTLLEITLPQCAWEIVANERRRLGLPPQAEERPPQRQLDEIAEADHFLAQSLFSVRCLQKFGVPAERITHLPLGIDADRYRPATDEELIARDATGGPWRALFVGQVGIRKGIHHLLQAWTELGLPNTELTVVGSNVTDEYTPGLLREHAGKFRWVNTFVPHGDLPRLFREHDAFVFPSLAEGGTNVVYEALASGLPCVVSENAGSAVRDGVEGFVTPVSDVPALKVAIARLHADRALGRRMGTAGRARAEEFVWPRFARRLVKLYRFLGGNGAAPPRSAGGVGFYDLSGPLEPESLRV